MIDLIRAKRDIRAGSVICMDCLEDARLPDNAGKANAVTSFADVIDKVARHLIPAGKIITVDDLEENQQ